MKTIIEKLATKNFVATAEDIGVLTKELVGGEKAAAGARSTYLSSMVATVQEKLHVPVRTRAAPKGRFKLSDELIEEHLKAIEEVHSTFYEAVLANLPEGTAIERNKASNFARSSKSLLRTWVKAGGDIRTLAAARVTKSTIRVEASARAKTPKQITTVMARQAEGLSDSAMSLSALDKQAAVEAIETVIAQLAKSLGEMGVEATRDPKLAISEHRPFRIKEGLFWPAQHGDVGRAMAQ